MDINQNSRKTYLYLTTFNRRHRRYIGLHLYGQRICITIFHPQKIAHTIWSAVQPNDRLRQQDFDGNAFEARRQTSAAMPGRGPRCSRQMCRSLPICLRSQQDNEGNGLIAEIWIQTDEAEDVTGSIRHVLRVAQFVGEDLLAAIDLSNVNWSELPSETRTAVANALAAYGTAITILFNAMKTTGLFAGFAGLGLMQFQKYLLIFLALIASPACAQSSNANLPAASSASGMSVVCVKAGTTGTSQLCGPGQVVQAATLPVYNVKNYGIGVGTGNATIDTNAAKAAALAMSATGGTLYFPGQAQPYLINPGQVVIAVASNAAPTPRFSIAGDGPWTSQIQCQQIVGKCISFVGTTASSGHESYLQVSDIGLFSTNQLSGLVGLDINSAAYPRIQRVNASGFDTGVNLTDVEIGAIESSWFRYNNGGLRCSVGTVTGCNNLKIDSSAISNNLVYGGYVNSAYSVVLLNDDISYNGSGTGNSASWGFKLTGLGGLNGAGLMSISTSYEGNSGLADVWINSTSSPSGASYVFLGGNFLRLNSAKYTPTNIYMDGSAPAKVSMLAVSFTHTGSYTPSSSTPYWTNINGNGTFYAVGDLNNFSSKIETPSSYLTESTTISNFIVSLGKIQSASGYSTGANVGANCPSGINPSTVIVSGGIITHC